MDKSERCNPYMCIYTLPVLYIGDVYTMANILYVDLWMAILTLFGNVFKYSNTTEEGSIKLNSLNEYSTISIHLIKMGWSI